MTRAEFDQIIDYAVRREREAVAFYQELQAVARFQHIRDVLRGFEAVERGHAETLERMRKRGAKGLARPPAANLGLADKLVSAPPAADLSYEDVLTLAMRREKAAHDFYASLAEVASDPELQAVFTRLAAEEAEHRLRFETLYEGLGEGG